MFNKIDSDTQVKIIASGHYVPTPHTGAHLPGAMSERVKVENQILFFFSSDWDLGARTGFP